MITRKLNARIKRNLQTIKNTPFLAIAGMLIIIVCLIMIVQQSNKGYTDADFLKELITGGSALMVLGGLIYQAKSKQETAFQMTFDKQVDLYYKFVDDIKISMTSRDPFWDLYKKMKVGCQNREKADAKAMSIQFFDIYCFQ